MVNYLCDIIGKVHSLLGNSGSILISEVSGQLNGRPGREDNLDVATKVGLGGALDGATLGNGELRHLGVALHKVEGGLSR